MKSVSLSIVLNFLCLLVQAQASFTTSSFRVELDNKGQLKSLLDIATHHEYRSSDTTSYLLQLKTNGHWEFPSSMRTDPAKHILTFLFPSKVIIEVKAIQKETHITFEVINAKPSEKIDRILWGSLATSISQTVGEIIGVVRDEQFAIGIQALNIKTTGGFPFNDEGYELSRGSAAMPRKWGSVLQAYSINRALPRQINVWNNSFKNMPVVPLPNENVVGSKIALFGVQVAKALETIGKIEVAEGLPHPLVNGEWIRTSPELGRSYVISNFKEDDVDEMIRHVKRAGLMSLYHEGPFKTWGKYEFNAEYFPHGIEGVKQSVKKVHEAGLRFGVHTLTNFINTSDPYVTPVPDSRLVKTGSSKIVRSITASSTEIGVTSPEYFSEDKNNTLHTVQIGSELIRYRTVSSSAPYVLLDCQRGSFSTQASAHEAGSLVSKLMDHPYEVFFPSITLQNEIAKNLAMLFNETGIDHLDFDGHEGGLASGQGDYGIEAFSKTFYDHADHFVVNGTSNSKHFYWHMNSYCNWGEPWYGGFRESMQDYRIANQALFSRNYMPNMMGWYLMTSTTSPAEMEWMLARAAGYNAGFAMVLRVRDAQKNPDRDQLLDLIREWETARRKGAFSSSQRERLKNPKIEFHLEKINDDEWRLYPFHYSTIFTHEKKDLQPGEPTHSTWTLNNTDDDQRLQFTLEVNGTGGIVNPVLTLDQTEMILPLSLQASERIVMDGALVRIYDAKGKQRSSIALNNRLTLSQGSHSLKFKTAYTDENAPVVTVMVKTIGEGEVVKKSR